MKTELVLKFFFTASHSLSGHEVPHPHRWRLILTVGGNPIEGRIIDIPALRESVDGIIAQIQNTYLNTNSILDEASRAFPTCETLSQYFYYRVTQSLNVEFIPSNPSVALLSSEVGIYSAENLELGAARYIRE